MVCKFAVPQNRHLHIKKPTPSFGQFAYNTTKVYQCQIEVFIAMQHLQMFFFMLGCWGRSMVNTQITEYNKGIRGQGITQILKSPRKACYAVIRNIVIMVNYLRDERCCFFIYAVFMTMICLMQWVQDRQNPVEAIEITSNTQTKQIWITWDNTEVPFRF